MQTFNFPVWLKAARSDVPYRKMASQIGISPGHLNNLEKGTAKPSETDLRLIATAFKADPEWLIAQVDTTKPELLERIDRLKKYAPEVLGLPSKAKGPPPSRHVVPRMAAGEGNAQVDPDRIEYEAVDEPFTED